MLLNTKVWPLRTISSVERISKRQVEDNLQEATFHLGGLTVVDLTKIP